MNKFLVFILSNSFLVFAVQAATNCDLKSIFQTPRKRNYDEFEILERSNFQSNEQLDNNQKISLQPPFPSSLSNAKVFLRLGDYKNAIRKNNNNINTRITLAGPNHNNYYHPSLVYPFIDAPLKNERSWNYPYSVPRTPQYYIFSGPNYVPRYQILPQNVPILSGHPSGIPNDNPRFFDDTTVTNIPLSSAEKSSSPSNGLNTMTVIPKILMDTVVKKPELLELMENQKLEKPIDCGMPTEQSENEKKIELGAPEIGSIVVESLNPSNSEDKISQTSLEIDNTPATYEMISEQNNKLEKLQIIETEAEKNIQENTDSNAEQIKNGANKNDLVNKLPEEKSEIIKAEMTPVVQNLEPSAITEPCEIHNVDHPRILHPVKLSGNIENVEILGAGSLNLSLSNNLPQPIANCTNSKDSVLVDLLQKSLVPFINLKTKEEPKFLVSYPVINGENSQHPAAIVIEALTSKPKFCQECNSSKNKRRPKMDIDDLNIMNSAYSQPANPIVLNAIQSSTHTEYSPTDSRGAAISGYQISSSSGYYQDPTRKIVFSKPTEIILVPPQISRTPPNMISQAFPFLKLINFQSGAPSDIIEQPILSTWGNSNLLKLLQLISPSSELIPGDFSRSNTPSLRTYGSDLIAVPRIVKCPHCSRHHEIPSLNPSPLPAFQRFPPHERSVQNVKSWNGESSSSRCPYCAKYTGELNQLEFI